MLNPSLLTKLKKQNNKIGAFHSNTKLFGKKKELTSLHACIPRASYHICSQCFIKKRLQPLFLLVWGWSSAPQPWQKSKGAAGYWGWGWGWGPAEPGHLPGSSQACLKGMVKWYWYLPIRNSLSYISLTLSPDLWPLLPCIIHENMLLTDISLFCLQLLTTQNSKESNLSRIYHACISKLS